MTDTENDSDTLTDTDEKTSYYKMFKVIMHDDPKTTMDFVTAVLQRFFEKKVPDAVKLMIEIHESGSGLAGVYPYEGAEFRLEQVHSIARAAGFPLSCTMEPDE